MDTQEGQSEQKYVELARFGNVIFDWLQGTNIMRVTAGQEVLYYEFPDEPQEEENNNPPLDTNPEAVK